MCPLAGFAERVCVLDGTQQKFVTRKRPVRAALKFLRKNVVRALVQSKMLVYRGAAGHGV